MNDLDLAEIDQDERAFDRWWLASKIESSQANTEELAYTAWLEAIEYSKTKPINMLLFCPTCAEQHVDLPQPEKNWTNPPHRSHECQTCGHVWRPADVPTNGVASIQTKGQKDGDSRPAMLAIKTQAQKALDGLNDLLVDEDLDDEKLRAASEDLLPNMADGLRRSLRAFYKREANQSDC